MIYSWLNLARLLGALAVIVVHLSDPIVRSQSPLDSGNWTAAACWSALSRWCVPIFILVSGTLLVEKLRHESITVFYKKRFFRIFVPYLFWSAAYLALRYAIVGNLTVRESCKLLLTGNSHYHLWYLYMIAGVYLFAPLLCRVVFSPTGRSPAGWIFLLFLAAAAYCICIYTFSSNPYNKMELFLPYFCYFLGGYFIHKTGLAKRIPSAALIPAFAALTALIPLITRCLACGGAVRGLLYPFDYLSIPVILQSLCVFLLAGRLESQPWIHTPLPQRFLSRAPSVSMGVYILHPLFIQALDRAGLTFHSLGPALGIPAKAICVFILSWLAAALALKIPVFRKTFG